MESILRAFTVAKGADSVQDNYLCKHQCIREKNPTKQQTKPNLGLFTARIFF